MGRPLLGAPTIRLIVLGGGSDVEREGFDMSNRAGIRQVMRKGYVI